MKELDVLVNEVLAGGTEPNSSEYALAGACYISDMPEMDRWDGFIDMFDNGGDLIHLIKRYLQDEDPDKGFDLLNYIKQTLAKNSEVLLRERMEEEAEMRSEEEYLNRGYSKHVDQTNGETIWIK